VVGLVAGSIATPFYAKWLMGTAIDIPLAGIFKQIAVIVFVPMVLGYLTQKGLIRRYGQEAYQRDLKKKFPMVSTVGVLGIVFVAMALKAGSILGNPAMLLAYLAPLALLYLINFGLSTLVGKLFFKRDEAIALVYGTVMRNLSIALAIAMTVFGEQGAEIAIIIAMAYIVQVQAAAWYVRFTDRIFGTA
jgi:ACR3 family arsenite efflux pump ArsB